MIDFHEAREKARTVRQEFRTSPDATLGAAVMEAVTLYSRMKADGATEAQRVAVIESVLREMWPRGRKEDWHELCRHCSDYGVIVREHVRNRLGCDVSEVTPCSCSKGDRFRPKSPSEQDFTQAGKVTKPKSNGFSQWGR